MEREQDFATDVFNGLSFCARASVRAYWLPAGTRLNGWMVGKPVCMSVCQAVSLSLSLLLLLSFSPTLALLLPYSCSHSSLLLLSLTLSPSAGRPVEETGVVLFS